MRTFKKLAGAAMVGAAAMTLPLMAAGSASADEYTPITANPNDYLQGQAVYFSSGGLNCSIQPNSVVGCDIPDGMFLTQVPFTPKVYDVQIDVPWFPAHPTFGIGGPRGHGGSKPLQGSLTFAGANCTIGVKGQLTCTSMGHTFTAVAPYLSLG